MSSQAVSTILFTNIIFYKKNCAGLAHARGKRV